MTRQTHENPVTDIAVAATVVLLRDSDDGPEVLLLERPRHRGSFAGAWVFPGGGVDPDDALDAAVAEPDEETVARHAAIREVREETGLEVEVDNLVTTACWNPPEDAPKRMRTWFYLAEAPDGDITLAPEEAIAHAWLRPADALARHTAGALSLVPPTWVTLHGLLRHDTVADVLTDARRGIPLHFTARIGRNEFGPVVFWQEDVAFVDDALALADAEGARHRLHMGALPWVYERSFDWPQAGLDTPGRDA